MNKKLIIFFFIAASVFPKSFLNYTAVDKRINDLTYNQKYDLALVLCDSLIANDELNPKYYFYYFAADAVKFHAQINHSPLNGRDSLKEVLAEKAITKMEKVFDKLEDIEETPNNKFYMAGLYGYFSRYAGIDGSWWSAYRNGIKSVDMFEEIIEEYPDCYDAYLYPGVFQYYADRLSGFTGFIASILGVSGDRNEGLRDVNLTFEKGTVFYPQAALMLLEIYAFMEGNTYASLKYFESFLENFPDNNRIRNWYVNTMLNLGLAKKTSKIFEGEYGDSLDNFVKAKYYFLTNEIPASREFASIAFEKDPPSWRGIIEYTKYLYVYDSWLMGDKEEVTKKKSRLNSHYRKKFSLDSTYADESKYIYKLRSLAAVDNQEAFNQLVENAPNFRSKEFENEFYLIQGIYLFQQKRLAEAEPYFQKSKNTSDYHNKVLSLRYLLDIYLAIDTTEEKAEKLIEEIEDSDYQRLIHRASDLEDKYDL